MGVDDFPMAFPHVFQVYIFGFAITSSKRLHHHGNAPLPFFITILVYQRVDAAVIYIYITIILLGRFSRTTRLIIYQWAIFHSYVTRGEWPESWKTLPPQSIKCAKWPGIALTSAHCWAITWNARGLVPKKIPKQQTNIHKTKEIQIFHRPLVVYKLIVHRFGGQILGVPPPQLRKLLNPDLAWPVATCFI